MTRQIWSRLKVTTSVEISSSRSSGAPPKPKTPPMSKLVGAESYANYMFGTCMVGIWIVRYQTNIMQSKAKLLYHILLAASLLDRGVNGKKTWACSLQTCEANPILAVKKKVIIVWNNIIWQTGRRQNTQHVRFSELSRGANQQVRTDFLTQN